MMLKSLLLRYGLKYKKNKQLYHTGSGNTAMITNHKDKNW